MRVATWFILSLTLFGHAVVGADDSEPKPYSPTASLQIFTDRVAASRERAQGEGKLQLVVLGGNWCHDSQDFAKKLDSPEMREILANKYVVTMEDVGYFELLDRQLAALGIPVLYGTPTAIILDPASGKVLNRGSLDAWRSSEARSLSEAVAYFTTSPDWQEATAATPQLEAVMASIDAFEVAQGRRVTNAFQSIGPIMSTMGKGAPSEAFLTRWKDLGGLRGPLPDDIRSLRKDAQQQLAQDPESIALSFPVYPPLMNEQADTRPSP